MARRNRRPPPDGSRSNNTRNLAVPPEDSGASRSGLRTAVLSAAGLLGLAAIAVAVLLTSLGPPDGSAPDRRPGVETSGQVPGATPSGDGGPAIAGTITIAPELTGRLETAHVLFIIARRGPGPPFAVKRISEPHFPLSYRLGPENVMMAGAPFEGRVTLIARMSIAGGAGPAQPGDLEGEHPGQVAVGQRGVDILIDRVH
jgi:cytochrome c-type biogenesis protein CcmH